MLGHRGGVRDEHKVLTVYCLVCVVCACAIQKFKIPHNTEATHLRAK